LDLRERGWPAFASAEEAVIYDLSCDV